MKKIAIIGTGIMGAGIAANFLRAHYPVVVWNRTQEATASLVEQGAVTAGSPREAAAEADIVFEVTANDESSRSVWMGEDGIIAGAKSDAILITCATLSVSWITELSTLCAEAQKTFFDMPMTGGRIGAESGQLILLAGGDEEKLKTLQPYLEPISQKVIYFGPAGSGAKFKLLLNMLQGIHIAGLGEVLRLAKANGMNIQAVGDALAERPGGTTTNLAWRDYQHIPDPINFSVKWIAKDLGYAKQMAGGMATPLLEDVLAQYQAALDAGLENEDWTAINR